MNKVRKLWDDEVGSLNAAEVVLLATVLVIGLVPGVAILRDAILEEMADTAQAISAYDIGGRDHKRHTEQGPHRGNCTTVFRGGFGSEGG